MNLSGVPYKFTYTWGQNAAAGFVTSPIPATAGGAAASQSLGFPPITSQPTGSGGIPPAIWDINGPLAYLSRWAQWQQAGGPLQYDATFQTNIGGYPNGAIIQSGTLVGQFWRSTADNNTTDPDTGGAGWVAWPAAHGEQAFTSGGTFTSATGVTQMFVEVWGGGGSGAGGTSGVGAGGASAGGYSQGWVSVVPGTPVTVTVGAPVAGGAAGSIGANGNPSSFGAAISCTGGYYGATSGGQTSTGTASGGALNLVGNQGVGQTGITGGVGGGAAFGGGFCWASTGVGSGGTYPGGGGGGGFGAVAGGAGSGGLVIVRW